MMGQGGIQHRAPVGNAPAFSITRPGPFIEWIVSRMEQISAETNEAMKENSDTIAKLIELQSETNDLLKEIRDGLLEENRDHLIMPTKRGRDAEE